MGDTVVKLRLGFLPVWKTPTRLETAYTLVKPQLRQQKKYEDGVFITHTGSLGLSTIMNACLFLEETQYTCPSNEITAMHFRALFWMPSAQQISVLARPWDRLPRKATESPSLETLKTQQRHNGTTCSNWACFEQVVGMEASRGPV